MSKSHAGLLAGALAAAAGLGGCGGQVFGGKEYDVGIITEPAGASVWVVPYNQYLAKDIGGAFWAGTDPKREWLLPQRSPATFRGQAYSTVALARLDRNGKVLRGATAKPFTPGADKTVTVTLEAK